MARCDVTGAIPSMVWIDILLAVIIYCAVVFGLMCFSDLPFEGAFDFVSLPRSLFAVLSAAIAAEWTVIVTPVVVKLWWGGFFWFLFPLMTSVGILNLIFGMISERMAEALRRYDDQ